MPDAMPTLGHAQPEDSRRQRLIEATLDTLAEHGHAATTFARIAARAEISPALLVHHFGDKDKLLAAAFRSLAARLSATVAARLGAARTPRARVQAVIDAALAPEAFTPRVGAAWLAFWGMVAHAPALRRVQAVYQRRMLSNLRHALRPALPAAEARQFAATLAALIDGVWLRAALSDWREADSAAARATVTALVDRTLREDAAMPPPPSVTAAVPRLHNWIDGREAGGGAVFVTRNPATGAVLAEVTRAGAAEVDTAVAAAARAQPRWAAMTGAERGRILRRAADLLRARNAELADLESRDTGKPIQETLAVDAISGAECLEYFAGMAAGITGEHVDLGPAAFGYTRREPLGVVAGIGAWNYPLQIACWKSAPALACGNAMIFKPAELTPLTAMRLAAIYAEAGLPDGLFNVVHGDAETGKLLTRHPLIRKISLTGEVGTGRAVMADAAQTLKHVTLELGGKSPLIVFEDAALDNAVSGALLGNFYSAGEVCSNGTRVFVHRRIKDAFLEKLLARVGRLRIGDPLDPATQIGALITPEHMQKVLGYVAQGRAAGARLLCGGMQVTACVPPGGSFVAPAVFDLCRDDMALVREEIFGPVMAVLDFETEAEVIARANATEYGLSAAVFTRDLARAHRVVAQLQAGTCWINHYNVTPVELPFGGVKLSGLGRENSRAAIEHYTQIKSVYVAMQDIDAPY